MRQLQRVVEDHHVRRFLGLEGVALRLRSAECAEKWTVEVVYRGLISLRARLLFADTGWERNAGAPSGAGPLA